ncbi:MAG TPA: hypothetical protein VIL34_01235 [Actinopolymorphaceae bacterium]
MVDVNVPAPTWSSPEDAAEEYFYGRLLHGPYAPKPPVHKWRREARERFEAELVRLEARRRRSIESARRWHRKWVESQRRGQ